MLLSVAPSWLISVVATTQVTVIVWLLARRWPARFRALLVLGILVIAAATVTFLGLPTRIVGLALAGCGHAVAYAGLLIWFGASLRTNHEPVVTGFARRLRQTMPDKVVRYTRRVTIAWCLFFAAQLTVSAALLLAAPAVVWSAFVNLLNLPLLAIMVLAEFGCRLVIFRHEPHTGLIETLSAVRHARLIAGTRP